MINSDDVTWENTIKLNPNCPQTPDHAYRILILSGSGSRQINVLLHLMIHEQDIDKIYL